jgi:hypothetical protein
LFDISEERIAVHRNTVLYLLVANTLQMRISDGQLPNHLRDRPLPLRPAAMER